VGKSTVFRCQNLIQTAKFGPFFPRVIQCLFVFL
jgi:hypothetical protein